MCQAVVRRALPPVTALGEPVGARDRERVVPVVFEKCFGMPLSMDRRLCRARHFLTMILLALSLSAASSLAVAQDIQPKIDNERVAVFDVAGTLPRADHDFVVIPLARKGIAEFHHLGDIPGKTGSRAIMIELKDSSLKTYPNNPGYPNAFPRRRVKRLFENERVIVWSYSWKLGEPTPMHFHDKDVVVVYEDDTTLKSTTLDGTRVINHYQAGEVRFNRGDRTHTELLVKATGSAVIVELK